MGDLADKVLAVLVPRVQVAMSQVTEQHCEQTRYTLSEPYPPASAEGEYPHKREGLLQEGVNHGQTTTDSEITETVAFSREGGNPGVPHFLEEGTETMAERPFVKPMIDRVRESFLPAVADRIEL